MKSVWVKYSGEQNTFKDNFIETYMSRFEQTGSGYCFGTKERDISFEVPATEVDTVYEFLTAFGFGVDIYDPISI